jgi:hypothetical protein
MAAHLHDRRDPRSRRSPHQVDHLKRPRVPLDGNLVADLDRERLQRPAEVIGCDVVEHLDGNPGEHPGSMTKRCA